MSRLRTMRRRRKHRAEYTWKNIPGSAKALLIGTAVVLLLAGGVLARYVWDGWSNDYASVTSAPFYFTVDLLGDSEMTEDTDAAGTDAEYKYSLKKAITGTWDLYGGGEQTVDFKLQNYYDNERITQSVIEYTVSVDNGGIERVTLTDSTTGNTLSAPQTLGTAPTSADSKFDKAEQSFRLTIPDGYTEETTVKVKIESTSPYRKTIELSFVLHTVKKALTYEIVDSLNRPYAELIIRNGTDDAVRPKIKWDASLSIDNTNELTFTRNENGTFNPQEGMVVRDMTISRALNPGESVSIYFFKSENKDYTKSVTDVTLDSATKSYIITIGNPTT